MPPPLPPFHGIEFVVSNLFGVYIDQTSSGEFIVSNNENTINILGLSTDTTPSQFGFFNCSYNHIDVDCSDIVLQYNTSCLEVSYPSGSFANHIVFNITQICDTNFDILAEYNDTMKNTSYIIRNSNIVFDLSPRINITDVNVYSSYLPTKIVGEYPLSVLKSVRMLDVLGYHDVSQFFTCNFSHDYSDSSLIEVRSSINMLKTSVITASCTYESFDATQSIAVNFSDYVYIENLTSLFVDNTIRTEMQIEIQQNMFIDHPEEGRTYFTTRELFIPVEITSETNYTDVFEEEKYFIGNGYANPYSLSCLNNSFIGSDLIYIVNGVIYGRETNMYSNNLPLVPDIDMGSNSQSKYSINSSNILSLPLRPNINSSQEFFFTIATIEICSVNGDRIIDIVDIARTMTYTSIIENIKIRIATEYCIQIEFSYMSFEKSTTNIPIGYDSLKESGFEFGTVNVVFYPQNSGIYTNLKTNCTFYPCNSVDNICTGCSEDSGCPILVNEDTRSTTTSQFLYISRDHGIPASGATSLLPPLPPFPPMTPSLPVSASGLMTVSIYNCSFIFSTDLNRRRLQYGSLNFVWKKYFKSRLSLLVNTDDISVMNDETLVLSDDMSGIRVIIYENKTSNFENIINTLYIIKNSIRYKTYFGRNILNMTFTQSLEYKQYDIGKTRFSEEITQYPASTNIHSIELYMQYRANIYTHLQSITNILNADRYEILENEGTYLIVTFMFSSLEQKDNALNIINTINNDSDSYSNIVGEFVLINTTRINS